MPKKSRKHRAKRRMRMTPKPVAVKEVNQHLQPLPLPPKQAPLARPPITVAERPEQYQYVLSDLRRAGIIAAVIFVLLIALSFFLR